MNLSPQEKTDIPALVAVEMGWEVSSTSVLDGLIGRGLVTQVIFSPVPRFILTRDGHAYLSILRDRTDGILDIVDAVLAKLEKEASQ